MRAIRAIVLVVTMITRTCYCYFSWILVVLLDLGFSDGDRKDVIIQKPGHE